GENIDQELVTPTGAAIVRELADDFGPLPAMRLQQSGYGSGTLTRSDGRPNLLRIVIGEEHYPEEAQRVMVIETSLDDWSPETWPHVREMLLRNGALDVILTPVHMKKGRPGFILKVICDPAHSSIVQKVIFNETSAIGLRFHLEERITLPREIITVTTPWGPVKAKKIETDAGSTITPEYEECRRIAIENNIAISSVYQAVCKLTDK
ncbi:MAG: LarC family nickel insertion protein, partial [Desulfobulbaceae bacterium]|nr:LarC family nickel insertion protein [Desulfobulbaceae bacterium]